MTIVIFILVLLVTVIAHEWGHFFAARKSGMTVEEFGFGIPPRLWSWKKGETRYSINALPIGGFVKIAGENGIDESIPASLQFETKPWHLKSLVLVAGVLCNIILAIVLFTVAYTIGMPAIIEGGTPTVVTVVPKSAADEAGLASGDTVQSIHIGKISVDAISTDALHTAIEKSKEPVIISYTHQGEAKEATLIPKDEDGTRRIGLGIEPIDTVRKSFFGALWSAVVQVMHLIATIWTTLASLVGGLFTSHSSSADLMGPVGLAREVGSAATLGFTYLLAFTAAISVNLAVLNIMPFPALDGGRLIVVLLEAITRRRFSAKVVGIIHTLGFLVLLGLMIVLTVGDVRKLL
jgi:regulator of sigma E protease